jgi:hypothetical protein
MSLEKCNASMRLQLWDGEVLMAMALIINKVLTDMTLIDNGPCAGHGVLVLLRKSTGTLPF